MEIQIISGSARAHSVTKRVAIHLYNKLTAGTAFDIGLIDMHAAHMPPVENVWNRPESAPAQMGDLARRVFDADAFILVSPEYNGSFSPALKNFLDHFPKQERKAFGIVTASPGSLGGIEFFNDVREEQDVDGRKPDPVRDREANQEASSELSATALMNSSTSISSAIMKHDNRPMPNWPSSSLRAASRSRSASSKAISIRRRISVASSICSCAE